MSPVPSPTQPTSRVARSTERSGIRARQVFGAAEPRVAAAIALLLVGFHFAAFDIATLPIVTDARYFLYFAWRIAEGAVPHVDLFDNKTFLASFLGALSIRLANLIGADPLLAVRTGFLGLAATGGWLAYFIHRQLGGDPGGDPRRGSAVAGWLGVLAYCSFGLIGFLAATGPLPKLAMAVLASAMALSVARGNWFVAGLAGGLAFMDWQVGALVWVAAFLSAGTFAGRRGLLRVLAGGAAGVVPFVVYYALEGALASAFDQTVLAAVFRGASTLARRDLGARLARIEDVVAWGSAGREWLVYGSCVGIPIAIAWLWRRRQTDTARLLLPLCLVHFGILGFSAVDFQGYGDLALVLQSAAFLLGITLVGFYAAVRDRLLLRGSRAAGGWALLALGSTVLLARPGVLQPSLQLTLRDEPVEYTLADQREVAAALADISRQQRLFFLDNSELLFLIRQPNATPVIFWNDAVWGSFRSSPAESRLETAERLVRDADAQVLVWHRRLGKSDLLDEFDFRRIESRNRRYGVNLWLR